MSKSPLKKLHEKFPIGTIVQITHKIYTADELLDKYKMDCGFEYYKIKQENPELLDKKWTPRPYNKDTLFQVIGGGYVYSGRYEGGRIQNFGDLPSYAEEDFRPVYLKVKQSHLVLKLVESFNGNSFPVFPEHAIKVDHLQHAKGLTIPTMKNTGHKWTEKDRELMAEWTKSQPRDEKGRFKKSE